MLTYLSRALGIRACPSPAEPARAARPSRSKDNISSLPISSVNKDTNDSMGNKAKYSIKRTRVDLTVDLGSGSDNAPELTFGPNFELKSIAFDSFLHIKIFKKPIVCAFQKSSNSKNICISKQS